MISYTNWVGETREITATFDVPPVKLSAKVRYPGSSLVVEHKYPGSKWDNPQENVYVLSISCAKVGTVVGGIEAIGAVVDGSPVLYDEFDIEVKGRRV